MGSAITGTPHICTVSRMEWVRQSCRAWGGRLARHRRHSHRLRVPELGMRAASKIPAAGPTATSPPTPLRKRRGENNSSFLVRGNRRLPLPSRNGRGGPPQAGRGRAVAFSSFQSAEPGMTTASKIAVCWANGNLTLTRLRRVGPSPLVAMLYPHLACESRAVVPKGPKGRKSLARLARAWKAAPFWIRTAPEGGGTNGAMLSVLCRPFGACGLCGAGNPGAYAPGKIPTPPSGA
jgi:hypothetical protein